MSSRARQIFLAAIELSIAEQPGFIERACGSNAELQKEVDKLLRAHYETDMIVDQPRIDSKSDVRRDQEEPQVSEIAQSTQDFEFTESPGTDIGPYRLLQVIGEGGMGTVYMAMQTVPVERKVALKVIKPGMDSKQVIARFEAERQALAMMNHPNIAKVLDAGTTRNGRPYFVMELVNGAPITEYCDQHNLTPRQRLELFVPVCHAVQHAHQKGVIHRDLKPSNIMVASYDDRPAPKVIDFGIAKATGQSLTDKTLFTQFGQIIGTLEYMSPEQAQRNQLDVDTRSDVYSLGVVLYELLIGVTPFDRKRLKQAGLDEILRMIREEDPPTPSNRLSSIETLPSVAANRQVAHRKLSTLIRGELDWIVMKSLEKERSRRYESANGLASDILRYLSGEAVEACPPSVGYRLKKFALRNKTVLGTALVIAAILLVTTAVSVWQAVLAARAREVSDRLAAEKTVLAKSENSARVLAESARAQAEENEAVANRNLYIAHMQQIRLEWESGNVGEVRKLLERYRKPEGSETPSTANDPRGWEWKYWNRMSNTALRTLSGHDGSVNCVAFNLDGSTLISAGNDGTLRLWETASGKELHQIKAHEGPVIELAVHPLNQQVVTAGADNKAIVWDLEARKTIYTLEHDSPVTSVAYSHDGLRIATGTFGIRGKKSMRKIWNANTGKLLESLLQDEGSVASLKFSIDDDHICCATTNRTVEYWNLEDKSLREIAMHTEVRDNGINYKSAIDLAVSSDSGWIASAARDGTVKLWTPDSEKELLKFSQHGKPVNAVEFHPNRYQVASAGDDNAIRIWDTKLGVQHLVLKGHTAAIQDLAFTPEGFRIASASADGTIRIWDSKQSVVSRYLPTQSSAHVLVATFDPVSPKLAYSPFSGVGIGDKAQWAVVQDVENPDQFRNFRNGHDQWIRAVAFSKDGRLLATGGGSTIQIWDIESEERLVAIGGSNGPENESFRSVANRTLQFSPDGSLLLGTVLRNDANGRRSWRHQIYDVSTGHLKLEFKGSPGSIRFNPIGKFLARIKDKTKLELIDALTGQNVDSWDLGQVSHDPRFSSDGSLLAISSGNDLAIWDFQNRVKRLELFNAGRCISVNSSLNRVFSQAKNATVKVWHLETGDLLCQTQAARDSVYGVVEMSSDGDFIATKALPYIDLLDIRDASNNKQLQNERESQALFASLVNMPLGDMPTCLKTQLELIQQIDDLKIISKSVAIRCKELVREIYTDREIAKQLAYAGIFLAEGQDPSLPWTPETTPTKEQLERALEYSQKALELDNSQGVVNGLRGTVLCIAQQYEDAIPLLRLGFEQAVNDEIRIRAVYAAAEAMCWFHLGKVDQAKAKLQIAKDDPYANSGDSMRFIEMATKLIMQ